MATRPPRREQARPPTPDRRVDDLVVVVERVEAPDPAAIVRALARLAAAHLRAGGDA